MFVVLAALLGKALLATPVPAIPFADARPSSALRLEIGFDYWESDGEKNAWGSFTVREAVLSDSADRLPRLAGRTGVLRLEGTAPPAESLGGIRRARVDLQCPSLRGHAEAAVRVKLRGAGAPDGPPIDGVLQLDYFEATFDELVPPERCGPGG